MIFANLSVFQNVLFLIACLGAILVITYLIGSYSGTLFQDKKSGMSDDFDHTQEELDEPAKFLVNAFTLKGSIFFLDITATVAFCLSLFLAIWASILIGLALGAGGAILLAFFDREKHVPLGTMAVVSENIPAKNEGAGKVIFLDDGTELDATTNGKALKKGKQVEVIEHSASGVIVKKHKRRAK